VNPNTTHTQISDLRRKAARRRQGQEVIPGANQDKLTRRIRSAALGLLELCELGAAGLTPMRTSLPAGENVNDLTRDQQHSHRPTEKDASVQAESAIA